MWKATAFEPFGGLRRNPSGDVLRGIRSVRPMAAGEVLPVTWHAARSAGARIFADHVRLAVHIGVAANRAEVCLERVARNVASGIDNDGKHRSDPLDEGPPRVRSAVDVDTLLDLVRRRWDGLARISDDCGRYVCNATFRASLAAAGPGQNALFVHVPPLAPERAASLGVALAGALDDLTRAW